MADGPVIDQFNLVVSDMAASVAFYRLIGFDIPDGDETWDEHHRSATVEGGIDLDLDSTSFAKQWDPGWRGGMGVLGVKVASREEVDERHAALDGRRLPLTACAERRVLGLALRHRRGSRWQSGGHHEPL